MKKLSIVSLAVLLLALCVTSQRAEADSTATTTNTTNTTSPTSVSTSEPTKSGCGGPALSTLLLSPLLLAALLFHA